MNNHFHVILSNRHLVQNDTLTVRSACDNFPDPYYAIADESGRVIRKGPIGNGINEFRLCIVGMKTGAYRLIMGQLEERFTVV